MKSITRASSDGVVGVRFPDLGIEFQVDQYQAVQEGGWLDMEVWDDDGGWIKTVGILESDWWEDGVRLDVLQSWAKDVRRTITLAEYDD